MAPCLSSQHGTQPHDLGDFLPFHSRGEMAQNMGIINTFIAETTWFLFRECREASMLPVGHLFILLLQI